MAWIESHQGLARHIKTKRLARKLGVTVPAAIGHLHLLWWWAMDNIPDGDLSIVEYEDIADEMMWEGKPETLISALIESGFVDMAETGLVIHDWHDYVGKLIEKRKKDSERKRTDRKKSIGRSSGHPPDVPRDGAGNSTVPNSTVQNILPLLDDEPKSNNPFIQVINEFCSLHNKLDFQLRENERADIRMLVDQGIETQFIIDIMKKIHQKKTDEGERITSFSYYTGAIKDAWGVFTGEQTRGRNQKVTPLRNPRAGEILFPDEELDEFNRASAARLSNMQ